MNFQYAATLFLYKYHIKAGMTQIEKPYMCDMCNQTLWGSDIH